MALDTYDNLTAAIADTLNRQDLGPSIPNFIALAEANFNRKLRVRDNVARVITNVSTQYSELPSDYREMKFVKLIVAGTDCPLTFADQRTMVSKQASFYGTPAQPLYYSLVGNSIELAPVPGDTYLMEMGYYSQVPALSATNTTNWLLTKHPDLYLYGALLQSAPYLKDDDRIPVWQGFHASILEDIRVDEERSSYSGATPRMASRRIG